MAEPGAGGELVIYEGAPLEQVSATDLIARQPGLLARGSEQVYITGEVIRGNYGVTGCLIVDAHPENRLHSYQYDIDGWYPAYPATYEEFAEEAARHHLSPEGYFPSDRDINNPEHFARFVGTAAGFKLVRAFLTPAELSTQIKDLGKFVGPAILQECFNGDDVAFVPDEEQMTYWPGQNKYDDRSENTGFNQLFEEKLALLEAGLDLGHTDRDYYVSFHGWPWYQGAVDLGGKSLKAAIARVDQLIASLDRQNTIATRGLGELVDERSVPLPASDPQE